MAFLAFARRGSPWQALGSAASFLLALGSSGEALSLSHAVLEWTVTDSSIARVDSSSGEVHPIRAGTTRITVSAGGWREASATVTVTGEDPTVLIREDWDAGWSTRWTAWGKPMPTVEAGPDGIPGMANNGDGVYSSGVYSEPLDAPRGLGVEALVSSPVSQSFWQAVSLLLRSTRYSEAGRAVTMAMDAPDGLRVDHHRRVLPPPARGTAASP